MPCLGGLVVNPASSGQPSSRVAAAEAGHDLRPACGHHPLAESEVKDVRFDFLKCLDLYHSKELDALARRVVIHPTRTYRQDKPPAAAQPKRP